MPRTPDRAKAVVIACDDGPTSTSTVDDPSCTRMASPCPTSITTHLTTPERGHNTQSTSIDSDRIVPRLGRARVRGMGHATQSANSPPKTTAAHTPNPASVSSTAPGIRVRASAARTANLSPHVASTRSDRPPASHTTESPSPASPTHIDKVATGTAMRFARGPTSGTTRNAGTVSGIVVT